MILKRQLYLIFLSLFISSFSFTMHDPEKKPEKKPVKFTFNEPNGDNSNNVQSSSKKDINNDNTENVTTGLSAPNQEPISAQPSSQEQQKKGVPSILHKLPDWLVRSALKNAPPLLKGILNYLKTHDERTVVPSFHRMILVGAPGTGKTTLAHALAVELKCDIILIPATSFMGTYRNEAIVRMRNFFNEMIGESSSKKVIIIDELHKLFEHHADDKSDNSETAAAFWLMLDKLEKKHPNIIVIGTANSVDKLPPEIKSRFHGKIITVTLPHKNQKLQAFKDIINNDCTVILDPSIDEQFIQKISQKLEKCSLRDIQLLVDTAKMFKYAESDGPNRFFISLERRHFEQAFNQLNSETINGKKSIYETALPILKEVSFCLSLFLNATHLTYILTSKRS